MLQMHTSEDLTAGFAIVCKVNVIKYLLDIQRLLNDINAYLQNADGVWESIIAFAFLAITTNKTANARILFHIPFTFFFSVYFYVDKDRKLMRKLLFICGAGILSTVKIKVPTRVCQK